MGVVVICLLQVTLCFFVYREMRERYREIRELRKIVREHRRVHLEDMMTTWYLMDAVVRAAIRHPETQQRLDTVSIRLEHRLMDMDAPDRFQDDAAVLKAVWDEMLSVAYPEREKPPLN